MRLHRFCLFSCLATFLFFGHASPAAWSQSHTAKLRAVLHYSAAASAPDGIDVQSGDIREVIVALRDDVVRVRIARGSALPEDASWAVLPESRHSAAAVQMDSNADHVGFRTRALAVELDKKTLQLTIRDLAGNILQQDARPVRFEGNCFRVYKTMPQDEHYFGLGDKTGPLDRRNEAFTMWNTDAYRFQESTDPIYKSIPYFMTYRAGRVLGVLFDNTWRTSFDFGKETPGVYSFGAPAGPLDYYVFYGPTPKQVTQTYAWLTGAPPLPPLWTLGFQQSRYSYMTQDRVLEVAKRFRSDSIPLDALYLDIDFQDRNRPFTVNRNTFPDLPGMLSTLKNENIHVVAITDLHIAKAPGVHYLPYDTGLAGDHFVKNPDGTVFSGKVWPGPSVFPDFTRQKTREWWGTLYRDLRHEGVEGFWNDMNEPSVFDGANLTMPENVVHRIDEPGFAPRTATHAEIHDVYGMENARATFEGLLKLDPDTRPFVLTRASYAGGQRYAATWTGDNSSSWNHLRLTTPMLENLGLSGFAFSGADVGGYAGTPTPELLTKWLEVGTFQPIDRDHTEKGTADQEPWVGGSQQEVIRRHFIETRYQLLPYIYTLAEEASRTGIPMMRPLFMEFPEAAPDRHPLDLDVPASGEFLLGSDLLVAQPPYPDALDVHSVELPSPDWYDFWTGAKVQQNAGAANGAGDPPADPELIPGRKGAFSIAVVPELAKLPVFVRGGAILPIAPIVQSSNETPKGPLTLRVYAGSHCSGELYQDDGKTFAYRKGEYLRMKFGCEVTPQGLTLTLGAHEGSYPAWWSEVRTEIYGWMPKEHKLLIDGKEFAGHVDHDALSFSFQIADHGKGAKIQVQ